MHAVAHIIQPKRSRCCGQTVLAMILNWDLDTACRAIGHRHGTKPRELRAVLGKHGITCGDVRLTRYESIPAYAILHLSKPTQRGNFHWMLQWDSQILDPANNYTYLLSKGWHITSFMPISIKETK